MTERQAQLRQSDWVDDGHTMTAVMDHDQVQLRVSCPGDSCKALSQCPGCEGAGWVNDREPCPDCGSAGTLPGGHDGICWLMEWFGEEPAAELFDDGRVDFPASPARIVWRSEGEEGPRWKFAAGQAPVVLTRDEATSLRLASIFGGPDVPHPPLESARRKVREAEGKLLKIEEADHA